MQRARKFIEPEPSNLINFVRLVIFYLVRVYLHKKRDRNPMSFFAMQFPDDGMRRKLFLYFTLASIFFKNFLQNVFLEFEPEFQLARTRIPSPMFVPGVRAPLV